MLRNDSVQFSCILPIEMVQKKIIKNKRVLNVAKIFDLGPRGSATKGCDSKTIRTALRFNAEVFGCTGKARVPEQFIVVTRDE